jgi:hypothetical protein
MPYCMASWAPASTDGMYSRGTRPPVTLFSNSYSAPSPLVERLELDDDAGELARTTGLLLVRVLELLDGLLDGLAVGDLRLADVRLDLEVATSSG